MQPDIGYIIERNDLMSRERWSCEKAWEWYNNTPWLRGCNFLPSDCCNRIAFWQELDFEKHLETCDRELQLASSIGYNTIRVILEHIVYAEEHDSFMVRFERFLEVAAKNNISVMVCFGNDCTVPKNAAYRAPHIGVQEYDWGYHGGRQNSPHGSNPGAIGFSILDEPDTAKVFFDMVSEVISKYKDDKRICVWDLFNEPGNNNRHEISVPHVQKIFDVARSCDPSQPLTSGVWAGCQNFKAAEKVALENSDVVSYHCYGSYHANIYYISKLRKHNRPLLNTEWLHRPFHDTVEEMFPLFYLEKVSCWNWGFVAGLSQTYEPWESMWRRIDAGEGGNIDVTKWQHDLFRPSLHPYDPKEIEIIKQFCQYADEDWAERHS